MGRSREFMVRRALGASGLRVAMGVLVESGALVVAGSVLGLALSVAGMRWVNAALPPVRLLDNSTVANLMRVEFDWRVFGFVVAICWVALELVSLAPMHEAAKANQDREGSEGAGGVCWWDCRWRFARRYCWAQWRWGLRCGISPSRRAEWHENKL